MDGPLHRSSGSPLQAVLRIGSNKKRTRNHHLPSDLCRAGVLRVVGRDREVEEETTTCAKPNLIASHQHCWRVREQLQGSWGATCSKG